MIKQYKYLFVALPIGECHLLSSEGWLVTEILKILNCIEMLSKQNNKQMHNF